MIKELLKLSGLNQKQFALKHNIPRERVSLWVTGKQKIKPNTLEQIAKSEGYKIEVEFKLIEL